MVNSIFINIMKEFLLIFRNASLPEGKYSPEEMQNIMKQWEKWMGSIAVQNKLVSSGSRLGYEGVTVKPGNVITNGPFPETKEIVGGYTLIKTDSLEDATKIAKDCPILTVGGSVEVRLQIPVNS
jgi:hypothetical protein